MSLRDYNRKRKFTQTPEPKGRVPAGSKTHKSQEPLRFVVQMHRATRLHFDFRLEFDGVFKSWAVPKGPSLNPLDQRLGVFVEDHPLEYGSFEGIIPSGNYGAGTVMIWDEGTYVERNSDQRKQSEENMRKGFAKGHITFVLNGQKLKGEFALIKLKKGTADKAWLLIKKRDEHATYKIKNVFQDLSVMSGRTMDEIAAQSEAAGKVWLPKRKQAKVLKARGPAKTVKTAPKAKPPRQQTQDAMPRKNKPMVATISNKPVSGKEWLFEPDLSGLRALSEVEPRHVALYSKSGLPFEKKFPEIVEELKTQKHVMVLDGEIVKERRKATYYVSDILYGDGKDLRKRPLFERKKLLGKYLCVGNSVRLIETASNASVKTTATSASLQMQIAKNRTSLYKSGTSKEWLKFARPTKTAKSAKPAVPASSSEPVLTNLDKIFWPKEQITKGDLIEYYRAMAPFILPYLKDRPQSLNRHPNGIAAPGFYQKDMTGHIPRWLKTTRIYSESAEKTIDYVLCQDERSLLYLANLGCIEMNPWFSRIQHLERPDFLVIDLDPDGNPFEHVIEIAHEIHGILEAVGAKSVCKTSGATGLHIGVPTGAKYSFETVRDFAENVCQIIAKKYPATTSMERSPSRRRKKIYLDCLQNRRGQTLVAPFSVRPRAGAPVSMPLSWDDLRPSLRPEQFNMKNALSRVQKLGDPWRPVLRTAVNLEKCTKALQKKFGLD